MNHCHKEDTSQQVYGEWLVALAVMFSSSSQMLISVFELYSPTLSVAVGLLRNIILLLLLLFQIKHYGIHIKRKHSLLFFIVYSFYIFAYIALFPVYKLEDLVAGPASVVNFIFRTLQLLVYILCAETIITHLNCQKFLFLSFLTATLPSIALIQYVGIDTIQYLGTASDDNFSFLSLGYNNSPLIVLGFLFLKKSFRRSIIETLLYVIIVVSGTFVLFAGGERGPIVWTIATLAICFFFMVKNFRKYIFIVFFFALITFLNIENIISSLKNVLPHTAEKIESTVIEGDTNGRFDLDNPESSTYIIAWNQFLSSPFYGSYFRLISSHRVFHGHYPHNVFLEIMITMGLVGLIPFIILLFRAYFNIKKVLGNKTFTESQVICVVLFLCEFLKLQTSKTIVFDASFWTFFYIVCNIASAKQFKNTVLLKKCYANEK